MAHKDCLVLGGGIMAYDLTGRLVAAVSAGALFKLYEPEPILKPGPAFGLVNKLLCLNRIKGWEGRIEVILLSRAGVENALQIYRSLSYYHMNISRAVFLEGKTAVPYLKAFCADLFLSTYQDDVQRAVDMGIAAGAVCECECTERFSAAGLKAGKSLACELRFAFDGDAVLFSDESEQIFKQKGLRAFEENERKKARIPLEEGPFAPFLKKLCALREELRTQENDVENGIKNGIEYDIRLALVTSRCAPAHERVIRTLNRWGVRMDEIFFLGGIGKRDILQAFDADIFFDDQQIHADSAAQVVPAALVPYLSKSKIQQCEKGGQLYEIRQYSGSGFSGKTEPLYRLCGVKR